MRRSVHRLHKTIFKEIGVLQGDQNLKKMYDDEKKRGQDLHHTMMCAIVQLDLGVIQGDLVHHRPTTMIQTKAGGTDQSKSQVLRKRTLKFGISYVPFILGSRVSEGVS
jgi:hypothetical protein